MAFLLKLREFFCDCILATIFFTHFISPNCFETNKFSIAYHFHWVDFVVVPWILHFQYYMIKTNEYVFREMRIHDRKITRRIQTTSMNSQIEISSSFLSLKMSLWLTNLFILYTFPFRFEFGSELLSFRYFPMETDNITYTLYDFASF